MKHDACTHPRTPAGRAACRKAMAHVPEHDAPATRRAASTPRPREIGVEVVDAAPGRPTRKSAFRSSVAVLARSATALDMVPSPTRHVVELAWSNDWGVSYDPKPGGREVRVIVSSPRGDLTLWWKATTPHGIADVQFRAARSSVTRRLPTVNVGVTLLTTGKAEG